MKYQIKWAFLINVGFWKMVNVRAPIITNLTKWRSSPYYC